MEAGPFLLSFLFVVLLGVASGLATGLVPGLHVNNVAALVLATRSAWTGLLGALAASGSGPDEGAGVLLSAFLVAATVSHAVLDFVPSVFFGAPSEESALSVLPGHRMLLRGQGALAVALAARASVMGLIVAAGLLLPLRLLLGDPVYLFDRFRPWTATFLVALLAALALSEASGGRRLARLARAIGVQALAGTLGVAVLRGTSGLDPEVALFPLFSGLFGLPGLLRSARLGARPIPAQRRDRVPRMTLGDVAAVVRGTLAGAAVSWLPGLSGGAAASLAVVGRRRASDASRYMTLLGAVATSTAILSVAVLFIIGRARSGTAAAVADLLEPLSLWENAFVLPASLVLFLAAGFLACALASVLAIAIARSLATRLDHADSRKLAGAALLGLLGMILALCGPAGLLVAGLAALVGAVPPALGVRRVHLMASLLLPVLLGYLAR